MWRPIEIVAFHITNQRQWSTARSLLRRCRLDAKSMWFIHTIVSCTYYLFHFNFIFIRAAQITVSVFCTILALPAFCFAFSAKKTNEKKMRRIQVKHGTWWKWQTNAIYFAVQLLIFTFRTRIDFFICLVSITTWLSSFSCELWVAHSSLDSTLASTRVAAILNACSAEHIRTPTARYICKAHNVFDQKPLRQQTKHLIQIMYVNAVK